MASCGFREGREGKEGEDGREEVKERREGVFGPQQLNELACNFFNSRRTNPGGGGGGGVISSCRNYERHGVGRRKTTRVDGWRECESRTLCMRVYFIYFTTAFRRRAGRRRARLSAARFSLTNNTPSRPKNANLTATGIAGDYARGERKKPLPGRERESER